MHLSSEEEAQQRSAVLAVQREMEDADEPNFLEEEGAAFCFIGIFLIDICYTFSSGDVKADYFHQQTLVR
jgi:hypothetical protein